MASLRGPPKTAAPSQQDRNRSNITLKSSKETRSIQRNKEKECVKQKIVNACNCFEWGNSENITNLCQLLTKLAVLSHVKLDTDIVESPQDFAGLLKLLKQHRYGYCNITTCCKILTSLLDVSGSPPYSTRDQAELLKELSDLWITKSDYNDAIRTAEQLAALANKLSDKKLEAEAYYILIKLFVLKGWVDEAKLTLEKCMECSEASEDELTIGYSKFATSTLHYLGQNFEKALAEAEDFLEIAKRLGDKLAECEVTLQMARIYCSLFDVQKGLNLFSEGLAMATALGHRKKVMETQANQASMYSVMGKYHKAYSMGQRMMNKMENYEDKAFKHTILCNLSVDALIIDKNEESLKLAQDSLKVAKEIDAGESLALSYGNVGLAQEKLKDYDGAIESYENCLKSGEDIKDTRIINNSYCNLGRAYEGKGDKKTAKEYYLKALNMPPPPSSHWCDTKDFRFSPDYLLGKLAVEESDYPTAKNYFQQVVDRCEQFRKSVQDSPLKICFNDTQKKPFQYLQHVLLKEKADTAALLVGEMGRGRDFYDKVIKEDQSKQLNTPEALIDLAKTNNQAVLFLSKLDVVKEMRMWFVAPDGNVTSFECPFDQMGTVLNDLQFFFSEVLIDQKANSTAQEVQIGDIQAAEASSESAMLPNLESNNPTAQRSQSCATEFRGVDINIVSDDESEDEYDETGDENEKNDYESGATPEIVTAKKDKERILGEGNEDIAHPSPHFTSTRGGNKVEDIPYLSDLVDKFSELIVRPIESHLKELVSKTGHKPELLIIPQGQTFNIPYSTLRLENGQPLCSLVAPREAFSFHSYSYSTTLQQEATTHNDSQMEDVLIVGNPTKDLGFAEREAKVIAEKLEVTPMLTDSATRSQVLGRLTKAPIIHFACHGTLDGKSLLLAPELGESDAKASYLTVEDISTMSLQANVVVLSACHTGRGKISSEGVLGLARAFLMAGAKSVVTALWGVNDYATEKFMLKFYQNLRSEPVVNALASTMCEMKREKFKVEQWGSFKVLGGNVKVL